LIYSNGIRLKSRSQWPRGQRRGSAVACLLGLRVRIPLWAWISVYCERWVLSGSGLCDGLITCREESYRVDGEASITRRPRPTTGSCAIEIKRLENPRQTTEVVRPIFLTVFEQEISKTKACGATFDMGRLALKISEWALCIFASLNT